MEMIKNLVKVVAIKTIVLGLGLFYTSLVAVGMLIKSLIKGKQYWYIKERTLPPPILHDAAWGRHSYLTLKVKWTHYSKILNSFF
jgi:hypothetical protein